MSDFVRSTSAGVVCINDCIDCIANVEAPFGGVGGSGYGRYNGKWGFDEFSHLKPITTRSLWLDNSSRYPPYRERDADQLRLLTQTIVPNLGRATAGGAAAIGAALAAWSMRSRL